MLVGEMSGAGPERRVAHQHRPQLSGGGGGMRRRIDRQQFVRIAVRVAGRLPQDRRRGPGQSALRHQVQVSFLGVGADQQVDLAGSAAERGARLLWQHHRERGDPLQRVPRGRGGQVESQQRRRRRHQLFVGQLAKSGQLRCHAEIGCRSIGHDRRLLAGEGAVPAAALHDRPLEQPRHVFRGNGSGGERGAGRLAAQCHPVRIAAEGRDVALHPAQRGENIQQSAVGRAPGRSRKPAIPRR